MLSTWKRKSLFWVFALASREIVTCVDTHGVSPTPPTWPGVLREPIVVFSTLDVPHRPVSPDCADRAQCVEADPQLLEDTQAYLRPRSQRRAPARKWRRAWERFHAIYGPLIGGIVRACEIPEAESDDCIQEIWTEIVRKLPSLDYDPRRGRFCSWLSVVSRRKVLQFLRRRSREPTVNLDDIELSLCSHEPSPAAAWKQKQNVQIVRDTLDALRSQVSATNYQVLQMSSLDGRDAREIASRLSLTQPQV